MGKKKVYKYKMVKKKSYQGKLNPHAPPFSPGQRYAATSVPTVPRSTTAPQTTRGNNNAPKDDAATASAGQKRKLPDKNKKKTYMGRCKKLLYNMMELDDSKPFRSAVDKLKYPDYHSEVRYDIDLTRIATKLSIGQYADPVEFGKDVRLMVSNWKNYIKDHSLPIYSQITRLSWWFESEYLKIMGAFEDHKNKRRRIEEAAASHAGPASTAQSSAIPTPPHLMSTVVENGILRIRRAPGTATSDPQSQAGVNMSDLRKQLQAQENIRRNLHTSPRTSTPQGSTSANTSASTGPHAVRASNNIAAVIDATRVAVSSQARTASQHNANTVTAGPPSLLGPAPGSSIASRLGPVPVSTRPLASSSVKSRLGPVQVSITRAGNTPVTSRLGGPFRVSPATANLPSTTTASPSSPRVNTTTPGNNPTVNNITRPVRTTTAPPRASPVQSGASTPSSGAGAPAGGASTPSGGAAVSTAPVAAEQSEPELELLFGASHVWFGECKSKPPRDIRITEQGIEFPIKSANYEAVISVNSNDIVRCCGHFGNLGKLQNTLFLFLTPSATKHVRTCLMDNGMTGDVVSLIVIFSQNMTTEKIGRLIHIFWRIGRQSIFGPLFSEVDKKGALNIIANIKPQILQRLSQNANASPAVSGDATSPAVRPVGVSKTVVPNLAAAQVRRNSSTEAANPSSTTPDRRLRSDRETPSGAGNTNGTASGGVAESQTKNSNNTASHGYTFHRSRLPKNDGGHRQSENVPNMHPGRNGGPIFPQIRGTFRGPDRPSRFSDRVPDHNFVEPPLRNRLTEAAGNFDYAACDSAFQDSNRSFNHHYSQRHLSFHGRDQTHGRYGRPLDQVSHWEQDFDMYGQNYHPIPERPGGYQPSRRDPRGPGFMSRQNSIDTNQDQPVRDHDAHTEQIQGDTDDQNSGTFDGHNQNSDALRDQPGGLSSTESQAAHDGSHDSNNSMEVDEALPRSVQLLNGTDNDQRRICIRISHQTPDENHSTSTDLEMSPTGATPPVEDASMSIDYNNAVLESNVSSTVQTCNTDTEVDTSEMTPVEDGRADTDTELVSSSAPTEAVDVDTAVASDSDGHLTNLQQNPALDLRPESDQVDEEPHEISDDDDDDLEIIIPSDIEDDLAFVPASVRQAKDEDGEDLVMMASRISTKCPVTQQVMRRPVKNRHCGHCYDRDGIQQLIINRTTKARCPVPGCTNPNVLMMVDMEFDNKLFEYIHTHNPDPELQRELDKVADELDDQPLRSRRPRNVRPLMSLDIYTSKELNGADSD